MAANPIYIETEEEIPEVIDRIRRTAASEVPLVLPARSRLGQSRFNFQLLKQYSNQLGKRVSIITADPSVQLMAEESGFPAYRAMEQYGHAPEEGRAPADRGPVATLAPPRVAAPALAPAPARIRLGSPLRMPSKVATEIRPGRFLLYFGSMAVLAVGIIGLVIYVPSAQVTLVAQAQPFSVDNVQVDAAPGVPPVKVRTVADSKQASNSFKATGVKTTPAAAATGAVTISHNCPVFGKITIPLGTRLNSTTGLQFATKSDVTLAAKGTSTDAPVIATGPGAGGNLPAGTITSFSDGAGAPSCLQVVNGAPTGGGADEKRETVIQQSDYDGARSSLEQQLRSQIADGMTKQVGGGEKLSDAIQFDAPDFATDHKVGDSVTGFTGTMTMKAEGAFFSPEDVTKAFSAVLQKKLAPGQQLVPNKNAADYSLSAGSGGHLTFKGTAKGFSAPKLDANRIKGRLAARTVGQAQSDLSKLPGVSTAVIKESPFRLPIMPLVSSRISLTYDIRQGAATPPKSG